jgi:non-specific serine/threonine protein kinase
VLNSLGELARLRGDHAAARNFYRESLDAHGERDTQGRAIPMFNLGQLELAANEAGAARGLYRESLNASVKLGARSNIAYCLEGLAGVATLEGQPERSARLLGAGEALRKAINSKMDVTDLPLYERSVAATRSALGEEAYAAACAAGAALPLEQVIELALQEEAASGELPAATAMGGSSPATPRSDAANA